MALKEIRVALEHGNSDGIEGCTASGSEGWIPCPVFDGLGNNFVVDGTVAVLGKVDALASGFVPCAECTGALAAAPARVDAGAGTGMEREWLIWHGCKRDVGLGLVALCDGLVVELLGVFSGDANH
jgi:hypothetical protein